MKVWCCNRRWHNRAKRKASGLPTNFTSSNGSWCIRGGRASRSRAEPITRLMKLSGTTNTKPEKIYCVGQNYAAHIREMGYELPEYPSIFTRFPRTFVPHKGNMIMPSHSEHFDYEGEMTVVIGTEARHVSEAEALDYVAGYTICNDGSVRDWQKRGPQVSPAKTGNPRECWPLDHHIR